MYFRFQNQAQVLTVEDDFARLVAVLDNGDLQFEFTYSISQSDVIKYNAQKVTIDVESRNIAKKQLLGASQRGAVDTAALVQNIRTAITDAKSTLQQQTKYQIASRDSDITAYINADVIPQLRARAPTSQIPSFNRPRLTSVSAASVKRNNDSQPVLHRVANSAVVPDLQTTLTASMSVIPQELMHDMITRQGLDPSYALQLTPRAISEDSSRGGLSNPQQAIELVTDPASQLLNFYLFPPTANVPPTTTDDVVDTDMVQVMQTVSSDELDIPCQITLPNSQLFAASTPITQVFVTFNLIDPKTNLAIDSITKTIDLTKYIHVYYTPRVPPVMKASSSPTSMTVSLEIKQIDPGATGIQLYKKSFWTSSTETDDYSLIGSYNVTARDQSLLVYVDQPTKSPVMYRAIAMGQQSIQGFEFTNVIARAARYTPVLAVALTAQQLDTGIQLEVRHLPTNAVAVMFLRWNMTTFDDQFTIAPVISVFDSVPIQSMNEPTDAPNATDVSFIDDAARQSDILTTVDTDVADGNIYRYVARVIYRDGATNDYGDATLAFVQPAPGQVDTSIVDVVVTHAAAVPNVTFNITTSTIDTDIDAVKQMLDNQGMTQFFQGDLQAQRDQLMNLIAHSVDRVDLSTGIRESFGILTVSQFDDVSLGKGLSVSPLQYGHRYRYEIYPLLRAAETMFDQLVKSAIDSTTQKSYSFSPAKFLHPYTLSRGVIVTSDGVRQRTAKDPMSFGVVGSITTTEVSFDDDTATITNLTAANFDRVTNVITWQILGNLSQVDHFIVMKQVHGIRTVIGKVHSEFANGACQYVHSLSTHDVGSLNYVVIPVYSDYRVGSESSSNSLIVEAP
jgi:hypothetical protein